MSLWPWPGCPPLGSLYARCSMFWPLMVTRPQNEPVELAPHMSCCTWDWVVTRLDIIDGRSASRLRSVSVPTPNLYRIGPVGQRKYPLSSTAQTNLNSD